MSVTQSDIGQYRYLFIIRISIMHWFLFFQSFLFTIFDSTGLFMFTLPHIIVSKNTRIQQLFHKTVYVHLYLFYLFLDTADVHITQNKQKQIHAIYFVTSFQIPHQIIINNSWKKILRSFSISFDSSLNFYLCLESTGTRLWAMTISFILLLFYGIIRKQIAQTYDVHKNHINHKWGSVLMAVLIEQRFVTRWTWTIFCAAAVVTKYLLLTIRRYMHITFPFDCWLNFPNEWKICWSIKKKKTFHCYQWWFVFWRCDCSCVQNW